MSRGRRLTMGLSANRRPLTLEVLERRLAMHGGTVQIFADIEIDRPGAPNINGTSQIEASLTFLNSGDFSQQSVVDKSVVASGTLSGFMDVGVQIDGTFEADEGEPLITFTFVAAPLLNMDLEHTGTFEAIVNGSPVSGTFVATIDAILNFDTETISGTMQIELFGSGGFEDSQTIPFANDVIVISPADFELPVAALGSIGDRIWYDDNIDGILNTSESGAVAIDVLLVDTVNGLAGDSDDVQIATTQSNSDGFYSFINIPPGNYYLEFIHLDGQQFTNPNVGSDDAVDSDVDPLTERTAVLTIGAATHRQDVDAGIRELLRRWQNPEDRFDVSGSGGVTPFDVSLSLRELKVNGNRRFDPNRDAGPPPYFDVNGDNRMSPQDVVQVLSKVLRPDGEGEASIETRNQLAFADADLWWLPTTGEFATTSRRSRRR